MKNYQVLLSNHTTIFISCEDLVQVHSTAIFADLVYIKFSYEIIKILCVESESE